MKNRFIKIALLTTLPMVAIQADNNISTIDPFKNDPMFEHFQKLQQDMNKIFEEFNKDIYDGKAFNTDFPKGFNTSPKTDFIDKGNYYELKVDLPGMDEKEIKVTLDENLISIKANSEQKKEEKKGDKIIRQERSFGMIQRTLSLPKDANSEKYKTDYKNGVLTVTIEKKK